MLDSIFISEGEEYKKILNEEAVLYLNTIMKDGRIDGEGNISLYYRKYIVEDSIGSIVISHGFGEFIEKYTEVIYYFCKAKYNVYIMEHRGHGRSGNLGVKDKTQIYVEDFNYYVRDLKSFIDEVVSKELDDSLFLFSHSMGGAISTKFLIDYPEYFKAAILESPMMTINTGNLPEFLTYIFAKAAVFLGFGYNYVPGEGEFKKGYTIEDSGTSSRSRFDMLYEIDIANEISQRGGPSLKWLKEAIKASRYITAKKNAAKVKIPILLFQAGKDTFVKTKGQNKFVKFAKNCKLITVPQAKHEIFRESDAILEKFMNSVLKFYAKNNTKIK